MTEHRIDRLPQTSSFGPARPRTSKRISIGALALAGLAVTGLGVAELRGADQRVAFVRGPAVIGAASTVEAEGAGSALAQDAPPPAQPSQPTPPPVTPPVAPPASEPTAPPTVPPTEPPPTEPPPTEPAPTDLPVVPPSAIRADDPDAPRMTNIETPTPATRSKIVASRRPTADDKVTLGFKDVPLTDTIRFIVESTGKVVMTRLVQVAPTKITLLNDHPISRHEALDLLFKAFRLNGIGVVETEREIIIDQITELNKIQDPGVVLQPDQGVMDLTEDGSIVAKVFRVKLAKAETIAEQIREFLPDYALLTVDANSNQLVLQGNVGLAKRVQMLIDALDKPTYVNLETRTFALRFTDASYIATVIDDLFAGTGAARAGRQNNQNRANQNRAQQPARPGQTGGGGAESVGTSEQLRLAVLPASNSITVTAEPEIIAQIEKLITTSWDTPIGGVGKDIIRVFQLQHADPVAVRDVLLTMLEGQASGGSRAGGGARGGGGAARAGGGAAAGGEASADVAVQNIFRVDAIPDRRQLVIITKTPENFAWLERTINEIDQPTQAGIPEIIALKYANAVEVAEQINVLLAESGTGDGIRGADEGLTRGDIGQDSIIEGSGAGGNAGGTGGESGTGGQGNRITFPWQQGRADAGERTPESSLIGRVRVVPIIRQNALAILGTMQEREAIGRIIAALDLPGRQVLIAAVVASVDLSNDFAYGLRIGNDGIVSSFSDNVLTGTISSENSKDDFISGFTSSVLNINVNAVAVLQALDQRTNVKILQQPKLFVADNTEGVVFIGQEVPFITDTIFSTTGQPQQSFAYKPVGVTLNVRPHITSERDVALEINLTLSEVVPGETLFGGAILNRRTTETQATLRNGQTVVLSGIRVETQNDTERKVPLLGDVPGIGPLLFTSTEKTNSVAEIIAFVTPIVVDNPSENDRNFNQAARQRLMDMRLPLKDFIEQSKSGQSHTFEPVLYPGEFPPVPGDEFVSPGDSNSPFSPSDAPIPSPAPVPYGAPGTVPEPPPLNTDPIKAPPPNANVKSPPPANGKPVTPPPSPPPPAKPDDGPRGGMGR